MKFCTNCGRQVADDARFCTGCGAMFSSDAAEPTPTSIPTPPPMQTPPPSPASGMNFDFSTNTATPVTQELYEYKVLTQKDKWFSGKFDPAVLEQAINAYAEQGWRVIGCATADIPGFGSTRQEFVTLLERKK